VLYSRTIMNPSSSMPVAQPRIALWFRYGPAEHAQLFHAMPAIVQALAAEAEVHYFGLRSDAPVPDTIRRHATIHTLPFRIDRTRTRDKIWKTLLWLLCLPGIGLWCRMKRVQAVYIDETVPLAAPLARLFFGPQVAVTIADFFVDIYAEQHRIIRLLQGAINGIDRYTWRRLPLIFTRARSTRPFLEELGIDGHRVQPVYDPCDFSVYHPTDRAAARQHLNLPHEAIVLVHHGILHPNKANDRILRALAQHRERFPRLLYLLIGDGPDMPRLQALVKELDLHERVRFTGWLPTMEEVNTALNAGDIGLVMRMGQRSDDFHMTGALVHSMACGLPVLAARLAGIAEVVKDDRNGYLFDPHGMADFPDALARLYADAQTRERLGRQALADARHHFDIAQVTKATVQPLLCLLDAAGTR
jgi:glycosyltransferase involved in cell wall biosynthesis